MSAASASFAFVASAPRDGTSISTRRSTRSSLSTSVAPSTIRATSTAPPSVKPGAACADAVASETMSARSARRVAARSGFEVIDDVAIGREARRYQRATEAAAAIDRHGMTRFDDAGVTRIDATHDTLETSEGRLELKDVAIAPPEGVALEIERLLGIDAGMDEEQRAVIGEGGTQARRPTRQRQHAVARRRQALLRVNAIGFERRAHAVIEHPGQDFARI